VLGAMKNLLMIPDESITRRELLSRELKRLPKLPNPKQLTLLC